MKIVSSLPEGKNPTLFIIPAYETTEHHLVPISFRNVSVEAKVFYGKKNSTYLVCENDIVYVFIGLGKKPDYRYVRTAFRRVVSVNPNLFSEIAQLVLPDPFDHELLDAAINGMVVGTYSHGHFKKIQPHGLLAEGFILVVENITNLDDVSRRAVALAQAQVEVLRLVDLPPNVATPEYLAEWATNAAAEFGFKVTVLDRAASQQAGLHAFYAVGQGSGREPQFIIMEYQPEPNGKKQKHIGLVGKGITFDTGGLNIKTAGMLHMKSDMAGGAAVLGTMRAAAELKLPVRLTAIVPCCENSVGSNSFLPGDVINSYSGKSIEIIDTDAEGRLILADGLAYLIKNYAPDQVVDIATLTGSAVATFGYECAALFSNNTDLSAALTAAGKRSGERVWPLPLWDEYAADIESDIADVRNFSGKPVAGAISAAKFLEYFTNKHPSWAHLDVAGVAYGDDEFSKSKHATAYGVQLLINFIENV